MRRFLKWFGLSSLALLAGIALAGAGLYFFMQNSVSKAEGSAQIAGLSGGVNIVRDSHYVPHIQAANRLDAMRALGWAHASDRLWQMHVLRMAAQGRLSEMFGEKTISSDRFLKTVDLATPSQKSFEILRPETQDILKAYADGVNAWINRKTERFSTSLPVEFLILGQNPEPWEPWHSIAIVKIMALTLDANLDEEIGRLALAGKGFDPREISEIYVASPRSTPPLLPDLRELYGFEKTGKILSQKSAGLSNIKTDIPLATAPWQLQLPASNNWVIAGDRTESGKPLLANDPHLGLTAPSVFYLAHLNFQLGGKPQNIIGGSLPGTPLILSGRNDRVAWGLTTTYLDSQDLFLEKINLDNRDEYLTPTGYRAFGKNEVTIKVKGGDDVVFTRLTTRHGPVLPDGYKKIKERLPDNHVASLSWITLAEDDTSMDAALDIGISTSVDDLIAKLEYLVSPMQSIVSADVDGNIGLMAAGRAPVRSSENVIAGRAPVPGWLEVYDWQGYMKFDDHPIIVNPANGALATANANWLPAGYQGHITHDWAEHYRQDRVEELFTKSNKTQNMESMQAGQADAVSKAMLQFRDVAFLQLPQGALIEANILLALQNWDGVMDKNRPEPLIMTAWHRHLQEALMKDDLGDDFELVEKGNITRVLNMLTVTGARDWCDHQDTKDVETCGAVLIASLDAAINELSDKFGKDWKTWRWGTAHIVRHEHRPFTQVSQLSPYFTISQEMSGGTYTLLRNSNNFEKPNPYEGMHGSAIRMIHDFSNLNASKMMISTGQSGDVFSPHYKDLVESWANVEFIPMSTDPLDYGKNALGTFELKPAN